MVIHDMRNPTNSIEFAVKEVLRLITQAINQDTGNINVGEDSWKFSPSIQNGDYSNIKMDGLNNT